MAVGGDEAEVRADPGGDEAVGVASRGEDITNRGDTTVVANWDRLGCGDTVVGKVDAEELEGARTGPGRCEETFG